MSKNFESFKDKLLYLMERDDKKRQDIANGTGISRSTVDKWFNLTDFFPKREALLALSKYFNVSLLFLCDLECTDDSPPSTNNENSVLSYLPKGTSISFHIDGDVCLSNKDLTEEELTSVVDFITFLSQKRG